MEVKKYTNWQKIQCCTSFFFVFLFSFLDWLIQEQNPFCQLESTLYQAQKSPAIEIVFISLQYQTEITTLSIITKNTSCSLKCCIIQNYKSFSILVVRIHEQTGVVCFLFLVYSFILKHHNFKFIQIAFPLPHSKIKKHTHTHQKLRRIRIHFSIFYVIQRSLTFSPV